MKKINDIMVCVDIVEIEIKIKLGNWLQTLNYLTTRMRAVRC